MAKLFSSDQHFWHANILEFDDRPFKSIEEMNEEIVARHNSVVAQDDEYHNVGDVLLGQGFAEHLSIIGRLNGIRKLYPGNHDRVSHVNKQKYRALYWDAYSEYFEIMPDNFQVNLQGTTFNISHFPYDGDHLKEERYVDKRAVDNGLPLIHGHTHSKNKISYSKNGTLQICISVTAWDYYPAHENEILDLLERHG
ncbi:phosphoesterase [Rhodococcus phage Peregrin]|nr:phosphoesterase [Rhodococcus phage Peregrin]